MVVLFASPALAQVVVGPFVIDGSGADTTISHEGTVVATVWSYDPEPARILTPLHLFAGFEDVWLVREHQGDGCPTAYRALCREDGAWRVSEPFGNCNDLDALGTRDGAVWVRFPPLRPAGRERTTVVLRPPCDPRAG